jgi:hypothetical protein
LAKEEGHRSKPRTAEQQIRDAFAAVPIDFLSKGVEFVADPLWHFFMDLETCTTKARCSFPTL